MRRVRAAPPQYKGRLFIAAEGLRTERNYISRLRSSRRIPESRIVLLSHGHTDPLGIVRAVAAAKDTPGFDAELDECWAVFDVDEHRRVNGRAFNEAVQLADSSGVHLATSNPSAELWLLLHFEDCTAELERGEALRRLKVHLPGYDKALTALELDLLTPAIPDAIRRAAALERRNQEIGYRNDRFRNPSCSVHQLVLRINNLPT